MGEGNPFKIHLLKCSGRVSQGQGTQVWAFPKPAHGGRCERRGWAGSMHSVGFLGPRRPGQERTAAGGTHLKVPVRVGSKHSESRVRHGKGSPGPVAPQVVSCPAQPLLSLQLRPEGVRAGGSGASSFGGAGQCLYQMPLDLPPGGARIRAEARFGTWSSI